MDTREQFELENMWRKKILAASTSHERYGLYEKAYGELTAFFSASMPDKHEFGYRAGSLLPKIRSLCRGAVVVDYGCGYGAAAMDMAAAGAKQVIGFEVSDGMREWARTEAGKRNLRNIDFRPVREGKMSLREESIDLIFCFDVCEHLHPEDFQSHLVEAYRVLKPRGQYYCETVLRRFGPNDISRDFVGVGNEAQGLHLKEYDFQEISEVFKASGFRNLRTPWISPRFLRNSPWRPLAWTMGLENSFLGRSGFATGVLGMEGIYLLAKK